MTLPRFQFPRRVTPGGFPPPPLLLTGVLALLLFAAAPVQAAVDVIQANAAPTQVEVGATFSYQITVTGSGTLPTPTVNLPSMFEIVSGPNSNLSMEFVNHHMSSSRTLSYTLRAMRKGRFTIPGPAVRVKGKQKRGNSIEIVVNAPGSGSSGSSSPQPPPSSGQGGGGVTGMVTPPRANLNSNGAPIFLDVNVSSTRAYFQQPIVITYTLYFQPDVRTYNVNRLSSTDGFWSEEWKVPSEPDVVRRTINGQQYRAAMIHRLILFPTKSGDLTIGPMELTVQYITRNQRSYDPFGSLFSDPFFSHGSRETQDVSSKPLTIHVLPLPDKGKPADFQNVVGHYDISAQIDSDSVETNQSVTFKVKISGEGNIGFLPTPKISFPSDIEVYEPQIDEHHNATNGTVAGEKTFTYLLLPRRPGVQAIPAVTLDYYDPEKKQYVSKSTKPKRLVVTPASGWAGVDTEPNESPSRVETLGTDIRWILDASRGLNHFGPPLRERPVYWLAYLIPVGVLGAGWGLRRRQRALDAQQGLIRSRKAAKRAMAALKMALDHHAAGEVETGYTALAKGVIDYLADRIGLPAGELDGERMDRELAARDVSDSSRKEIATVLDLCNSARFTPQGADPNALGELIERTRRWITQVDRSLEPRRS